MADPLRLDLRGRLRNFTLPASSALVPVFEAVINGLHAILESKRKDGRITITILRKGQRSLEAGGREPIYGFAIEDNGIGFNEENYGSFLTSDTLKKAKLGGRGVGRLTWAKAFSVSRVDSAYRAKDGLIRRRRFTFSEDGITDVIDDEAADGAGEGTKIVLEGMEPKLFKQLPKTAETIGERMVDHFLVALRANDARVVIHDEPETYDVTGAIEEILRTAKTSTVNVLGATFKVTHAKVSSGDNRAHRLAYLANDRPVKSENLDKWIPQLRGRLTEADGTKFWSLALVESDSLDRAVSGERDTFSIPEEPDPLFPGELSMGAIHEKIAPTIVEQLGPYLSPLREKAVAQAKDYVETDAPQYRSILKAKREAIGALPPDLAKEKLDVELRRLRFQHEEELRERATALLSDESGKDTTAYDELLTETNAAAIDDLAKYVKDRRVILNLMRQAVRLNAQGKYELEKAIHKLVLPMNKTSDDIPFDQMNLWLIDERLAFHSYLASDKQFATMPPVDSASEERPDVIVFNRPIAFAEDASSLSQSVVIIEFKRAMRDDYDEKENPIAQVYDYVEEVRDKKARTRDGRPLVVPDAIPFYCYVICDLTTNLCKFAKHANLRRAWDGRGFFGYNDGLHAYVEVISFDKLIDDAEKRNRTFFEKLGLPRPR